MIKAEKIVRTEEDRRQTNLSCPKAEELNVLVYHTHSEGGTTYFEYISQSVKKLRNII